MKIFFKAVALVLPMVVGGCGRDFEDSIAYCKVDSKNAKASIVDTQSQKTLFTMTGGYNFSSNQIVGGVKTISDQVLPDYRGSMFIANLKQKNCVLGKDSFVIR